MTPTNEIALDSLALLIVCVLAAAMVIGGSYGYIITREKNRNDDQA